MKEQIETAATERKTLAQIMDECRYCKAARAKSERLAEEERGQLVDGCRKHMRERYLAYVTSPASETYWSS